MGLNHVYKVIWSKTKGCYVVVSEMAKRVGRNKAKAIVMSTAAMAMAVTPALMNVDRVEAEVLIGKTDGTTISANGSTVNSWGITIGGGITNAGSHSVHVGDATLEEGERNVIIGTHATAGVDNGVRRFVRQSTAIGGGASANEGARAFGDQSIAIGANTIAEGNSSIAIGNDDVDRAVDKQIKYTNPDGVEETNNLGNAYNKLTGKNLLSDGGQYADTRSGEAAIAIGVKAEAGDISLALGTGAKAKKVNTVSIGTGATADLDNSVAIGGGAVADKDSQGTKQTSTTINGIIYKWAGGDTTNPGDVVSFGKPGFERQLKNIAAGEISSTSTDAINGSQIHSLVEKITGTPKLSYTTQDGTPVYKFGDKFYKVNEKGQRISAAGKPEVGTNQHGQLVDADNNVIEPINSAATPLKTALVNSSPEAGKTGTTSPTALNNITSNLVNFDAPNVNGKVPAKNTLRNLVNDAVSDDTVATVGDLRNMGWIVSADKTKGADETVTDTAYSATVKNANEVKFVGKDGAIVSGTTDAATGVRTITVGLDKKAMSGSGASASPVAYTKADGTKVYPVKAEDGSVTYHTTPNGEGPNDAVVPGTEVITSVNGPDGTTTPATLTNVAGNLVGAKKDTNAPTTEQAAPTLGKGADEVNPNNAATVGDVLNAGWNLQNNDVAKDFVKAYDTVNFVDGEGTTAVVETTGNKVSKIKYNVNTGNGLEKTGDNKIAVKPGDKSLEVTEAGVTVKKADRSLEVTDDGLKVKTDGKTITVGDNGLTINTGTVNAVESGDKKGTVEVPTADAGKIATVDTVVKAVNSASFTLKASATTEGTRNADSAVDENGEQIKAGSTVELVAGKNLDVKHDTNGKITFATKDEVAFNTVQIGGSEGPKLTKTDSGELKLSDKDGTKPVAITNVKSNLPETKNGAPAEATKAQPVPTLGTEADQVNANNAATVGDVLNAGWNVQENGTAKDFVKPYDKVNFVNGGNTTAVVTTNAEGTVSNVSFNVTGLPVSYTTEDGKPVSKVGDKFYKVNEQGQPVSEAGKAAVGTNAEGKLVDADNNVIEAIDTIAAPLKTALVNPTPAADKTGTTSPTALNNVTSGLNKYGDQVDGKPVEGTTPANTGLIDLSTPADGAAPKVSDNTAATVGDLRNMGWIVSADKTTGDLDKAYSATVKNANEVKFVGTGTAIVSGETKDGVRTITVNVDDQVSANNAKTPVVYTKADGTKVYPIKGENGAVTYHTTPDGKGDNDQEVPGTEVITSVNSPDGTTTPATLANVAGNLDGAKKDTTAPKAEAAAPNTTNKDGDKYINPNNAATVGDVLNAGWNLQNNGEAKDFVKPYDTVNFVDGANTTAVVTTSEDGTTSKVTYNVTGLPVSYTTEDGKPVSKVGDKFYKVNEQGQPVSEAGKPAVGTNAEGKLVDADNNVIEPIDTTAAPLKTALVNPTPAADKTSTTSPTALNNVTSGLNKYGDQVNGNPVEGTTPANTGLIDLSTPADGAAPKVSDNTAATVGDLRNMGWIVSADKTTGDLDKAYSATVKNANEVKFVGTGTAIVSGETKDGVRTITVNVDDQVSANNAKTPVVYTKADGTKVYPIKGENGAVTYHTTPDGKGDNDQEVPGTEVITSVNSPDGTTTPATLANVAGNLDGAKKDTTAPKAEAAAPNTTNKDGDKYINPNNAATVGDVLNAGWNVQENGTAKDFVKPYDKVNFVNGGNTTAVVTTNAEGTVSNVSFNVTGLPVSYTTEDGKPVSKVGDKFYKVNEQGQPISEAGKPAVGTNAEGKLVDADNNVIEPIDPAATPLKTALVNPTPAADKTGTTSPTQLTNVEANLEGAKTGTNAPTTAATAPNTTDATQPNYVNTHNAATVGDVLQAGWNLQNNGEAKDFVKPFDKVNFVNGGNTTAVVTTNAEGTVSNVSFNVTGLPVSYTTEDGKPVSKVGDKFYKVNEQGQPISEAGKPAVGTNAEGKLVDADNNVIEPIDTTAAPLKTALVNPTPAADKTGTTSPTALNNVTSGLNKYGDQVDGKPVEGTTPANTGLIDLSTPADGAAPKVSDNTAATVGDLRNMGWIVSADKTTGDLDKAYSATVKNANEVKFVGTGTAIVSGETKDGVRTITVNVDDQVSANNAKTPVVYTKADGTKVYPIKGENGAVTYHTTPDGKGDNDQEVPGTEVITSVNSPDGTTTPATLANVAGNLDGAKKDTTAPKAEAAAPNTTNKDGDKYINPNNAATVGDVLNAGWNLQENGTAKDFVKPYDTVNFINGANTTAVVTTSEDGTTSKVTYNVTGLPVSYTTKDGKPVSKVGDKFYKVNEKGQPLAEDGTPAAGTDKDGNPITANGTVIKAIDPTVDPLKTALVNPNPEAGKTGTTAPTQLTNVANGADTFKPANDVKQANDGKWYNASDVEPNGKVKDGAKSVASPVATKNAAGDVLEKGKDGNWYKASDLENGEPKPNVDAQTPVAKPENAEKAGLVNFEGSNPNNAATVGDLQNLGFIVSAADNGYTEQMRNANKVEFKGSNGVSVTGKTLEDGTREITVALKEGRVTNNVIITKADGTEVHGERGEDGKYYQYEKDPVTGQPKKVEVPVVAGDTVTNDGDAYVTGNSVATAIQKSGWNIGIGSTDKAFSEEEKTYEHVNPNDHVKYVNGDNTTVSMAVDPEKDRDGTTVTTTYVKVDVKRDLKIDSLTTGGPAKDKDGNSLQEINGEYYPANAVEKDGKAYPAGTVFIDGKAYPAGSAKDPNTNGVVKDGQPATEVQPLTATPKDKVADGKDGAMTVKDAKGKDGVSATAKDGKGVLTLNNAGTDKDGKDASTVNISTGKAPTDLGNTPKDGSEVPTMDRIQYTDGTGTSYNVATMNDGLRFVGDDDKAIDKTLNSTLTLTGGNREATNKPVAEEATTTGNIGVFNKDGKLSIQLAKDLDKLNSANFESKTDKAGNPLKAVDGKYYPENSVVQEGKVYPEGTVIIDNKPYPAGTTKDAAGNVVNNGKPATEATPIKPIDSTQVQDGPTSKLTGTGLNFNTPAPKDENGNPLILVDGKYYKADNLENGKPKAEAKPEAVKPAQSTAITPDGLAITPDTAKVVDPKTGEVTVDSTKVVSFGAPSIVTDPATGKAVIDPKTGEPVMKSGISAGGQVMSNVAPGVLDTDAVNVSQLKGVAHNINMRMNRMGAQAAAMASLQSIQYDPLEPTQISAGVGHYKGASALALGVNHFKNESTMFHMGASLNGHGDESMINASVTWKFGGRADETAVKDTFRQGPISASYTLQDKVSALEEQNQVLKEQVAELFRRLNEKA